MGNPNVDDPAQREAYTLFKFVHILFLYSYPTYLLPRTDKIAYESVSSLFDPVTLF
jgi:hypothetical protein